ncbi:MAG: hypothetical protein LAT54_02690, partial [Cryomorphaceae bacterium]|nr:hypothetical protein [Cryomorphaceae bacterium]
MKTTNFQRPNGQTAKRPNGQMRKSKPFIINIFMLMLLTSFLPKLFAQSNIETAYVEVLPYELFGNGDDYEFNTQSSLQDNYLFRWPLPFVPGDVNIKVRIHYINAAGNTVPTQIISSAKQNAVDIFAERNINITFQSERIHQAQDWEPINGTQFPIGILHDDFFNNNPPITPFESDEIHIAIFDKDYILHPANNKMPYIMAGQNNPNHQYPRVNVFWERIPTRKISIAYPNILITGGQSFDYFGPFDEEKIINASITGGLGSSLGLIPLNLSAPIGANNLSTFIQSETNINCNIAGDFLCDTKPYNGFTNNHFDPNSCSFFPSSTNLVAPSTNIMAYHAAEYGCIDHLTEEQARKIRYVLSNDSELHGCLTQNSTLLFDNFEITPIRTVITQNTTWTKPAALHILEVEEGAVFTTESSIDFAPGYMSTVNPLFDYDIYRWADYSNGYNQEINFDHETKDDVHTAWCRVAPASRLNVYGGSLNSYYSHWPWQGITAEGNRSQPQTQAHQAVVHLDNATIRMAHEAIMPNAHVTFGVYQDPFQRISSTTGSYVLAFDTDFINCRRVIGFRKYANMRNIGGTPRELNNLSHFTRCNIIHNDDYRFKSIPLGITMHMVKGVNILGCKFENTISNDVFYPLSN